MRRPIIAGNWKMNNTLEEAKTLVRGLIEDLKGIDDIDIVLCPPYTVLFGVMELICGSNIMLGAQNLFHEREGPYTGEISPIMLKDAGCRYVIIGHSERRIHFGERDEMINKKVRVSLAFDLTPILCIGETAKEREKGEEKRVVLRQLSSGLESLSKEEVERVVLAYEPVWAIGTGKTATPEDAEAMHLFIRETLSKMYGRELAQMIRIQYGGSVRPDNIDSLMRKGDIDGVLVGGASLKRESFSKIVRFKRDGYPGSIERTRHKG
jgi:triosephosphate isomerase